MKQEKGMWMKKDMWIKSCKKLLMRTGNSSQMNH